MKNKDNRLIIFYTFMIETGKLQVIYIQITIDLFSLMRNRD